MNMEKIEEWVWNLSLDPGNGDDYTQKLSRINGHKSFNKKLNGTASEIEVIKKKIIELEKQIIRNEKQYENEKCEFLHFIDNNWTSEERKTAKDKAKKESEKK